jgi:hypothetical protein
MALKQPIKQGLDSTTLRNVPKEWDAEWFRRFMVIQLKAADARNTIAGPGITITGSFDRPGVISCFPSIGSIAPLPPFTIVGNPLGTAAPPQAMSGTVTTSLLDEFTAALKGLVPPSGGGTVNFLRADGVFTTVDAGSITPIPPFTVLGNDTGGSAPPTALIETQLTSMIQIFTATLSGAVPASGGGTLNFLRADGTFAPIPGAAGLQGAAAGGTFLLVDTIYPDDVIPIPGPQGPAGKSAVSAGTSAVVFIPDDIYPDEFSIVPGPPGPAGPSGSSATTLPSTHLLVEDMWADDALNFPGAVGPAGASACNTGVLIFIPDDFSPDDSDWWMGMGASASSGITSLANPSGLIGLTAVNGVATTAERSDSTHAIDQGIVPTWTGAHIFRGGLNPITVGGAALTGVESVNLSNTSTVSGDRMRLTISSGATSLQLYATNINEAGTVVTGGPTGAQGAILTIGAQPIVFGTNNTFRGEIGGSGAWTIAAPTSGIALTITGDGTNTPVQVNAGAVSLVTSFDSTNANGPFISLTRSGTAVAELGSAKALVTGGLIGDAALIAGGTTNNLILGANGATVVTIGQTATVGITIVDGYSISFLGTLTPLAIGSISDIFGSGSNANGAFYSAGTCNMFAGNAIASAPNTIFNIGAGGVSGNAQTVVAIDTNSFTTGSLGASFPKTKTSNYVIAAVDYSIIFNGAGSISVTMPTPGSFRGRMLLFKTIAAQTVVSGSSNIVPLATAVAGTAILAATAGKWALLQSDGSNWVIMASN